MAQFIKAQVRSVLSGDTLVLQSTAQNPTKPRIEKTLSLAFVSAPRLKREGDEPFAFEAREFIRERVLSKLVKLKVLYNVPTIGRDYGVIELDDGSSLTELLLAEGLVKVREEASKREGDPDTELVLERYRAAEAGAREEQRGVWGNAKAVVTINDVPTDPHGFLAQWKGKVLDAIVERIISGDRVAARLFLDPKLHQQAVLLVAGIKAPASARPDQPAEKYGQEAKEFVETRLLQRKVKVELVGVSQQGQFIAKVIHPKGSIAKFIVEAGLARCLDAHSTLLGPDMSALRAAENQAKAKKLKLWEGHVVKSTGGAIEAIVARVFSPDTLILRNKAGAEKKVSLSSIRQPKPSDPAQAPFSAEAKEFLRKRLIGKKVHMKIDGKKPASEGYEERETATVTFSDRNIALVMVENGYASVIRHRKDDEDRSPIYDDLLLAEERAKAEKKGMWSGKAPQTPPPIDASENIQKAKSYLSFLQRKKRVPAVVDYVASGGRFKIYVPSENAKLTFVLSGLTVPRTARNANEKDEPFAREAFEYANRRLLQRDVEIDVENTDKVGGFIGTLWINRENFAKALLEEGLASVHAYSAEKGNHSSELFGAERRAQEARKGLWVDWDPEQEEQSGKTADVVVSTGPIEKRKEYRKVLVSNVEDDGRLKVQIVGETTTIRLEKITSDFRKYFASNSAPLSGPPKFGQILGAQFSEDNQFYRAKVKSLDRENKKAEVVYIDYGNRESIPWSRLRVLPDEFGLAKLKPQAADAALSFVQFPAQEHYLRDAVKAVSEFTSGVEFVANVDYIDTKDNNTLYLTLYDPKKPGDVASSVNAALIEEGLALVPRKVRPFEKAYQDTLTLFKKKEDVVREEHVGIWEYGDFTEDD